MPSFSRSTVRPFLLSRKNLALVLGLSAIACALLPAAARAQGTATLTTLYTFNGDSDGSNPNALVQGSDGNFYGTTAFGGTSSYGAVFKLAPDGTLTTLYSFTGGDDGAQPLSALLQGKDGAFYGTTVGVVANTAQPASISIPPVPPVPVTGNQYGSVFKIMSDGTFTLLHLFSNGDDGSLPFSGLALGNDGNFYGTTNTGGTGGYGTVYRITPDGTFTTLYGFTGGSDGGSPSALILGRDGNFYGTTGNVPGTVFQITPDGVLTTLYSAPDDGDSSLGSALTQGADGAFYSVGFGQGSSDGTVFRFDPAAGLTTLHTFTGPDGVLPSNPLTLGGDGNFYGSTLFGGVGYQADHGGGNGTLFQLTPAGALTRLYDFAGDNALYPSALVRGSDGAFYGTTQFGGANGYGTIFKLVVTPHPAFFTGQAPVSNGVDYLTLPNGNVFGFYNFLSDPAYLFHDDLGYEYIFDAADGQGGVYLYDFASQGFFYTAPNFPFPYLYDFSLGTVLYYYPDANNPGHYTSNPRTFYNFATQQVVTK